MQQDGYSNSNRLLSILKNEVATIDASMRADLGALSGTNDARLVEVLDYGLFNGGKRIRPLLTVKAARLCNPSEDETELYRLGIAFEYLHAATLFHDDIIDQSDTRRGKPCIHQKFGLIEAILTGDFLHAHSMAIIGELAGQRGLEVFCKATKGMVDGEFMQLRNAEKHNLSELDYYNAIMGKTGLLISAACEVGGIYGDGDHEQVYALKNYGEKLGCAFQIVDDLLDYLGDSEKTGKKVGNDLKEGKMTLPLIAAVNNAGQTDRERLLAILNQPELRETGFAEVSGLIDKYDGFTFAKKMANKAVAEALEGLQLFSSPEVVAEKHFLEELAQFVVSREK